MKEAARQPEDRVRKALGVFGERRGQPPHTSAACADNLGQGARSHSRRSLAGRANSADEAASPRSPRRRKPWAYQTSWSPLAVVAGQRARTVRILDNLVEGVAQGIHVATSTARSVGRESAGEVMISRNVVRVLIPIVYNRGRHAIFVGNTRRLSILDNVAELTRSGKEEVTPLDGIRLYGVSSRTIGP